jgi:hypothetical protein
MRNIRSACALSEVDGYQYCLVPLKKVNFITRLLSLSGSEVISRKFMQTSDEKIEQTVGCYVKGQRLEDLFSGKG